MPRLEMIDFHHHSRPASFWKALTDQGIVIHGGRPFPPRVPPDQIIEMMDRVSMAMAILSSPDPEGLFADRDFALKTVRPINDYFAEIVQRWPNRFGALVCLPLPHLDLALEEMAYGLDTLKLDGVMLLSSYLGHYTGSPEFDPVLEELNRRGTTVLVHPVTPIRMDEFQLKIPSFVLEFVNDTSRCIVNCLQHDIPRRFPNINFVFSHAGGTVPYLAPRLALVDLFGNPNNVLSIEEARAKTLSGLRSFYYDTALSAVDSVFSTLADTVGLDRVVFGSDFPQAPESFVLSTVEGVRDSKFLDDAQKLAISQGTLLSLLPHLKSRIG